MTPEELLARMIRWRDAIYSPDDQPVEEQEMAVAVLALSTKLQEAEQHFCVRCHHRWKSEPSEAPTRYCGDCHRECQALNTKLQDVQDGGLDLRVIRASYGWTIHSETGEVHGLTAGDQGFEPTGIKIPIEELKSVGADVETLQKKLQEAEKARDFHRVRADQLKERLQVVATGRAEARFDAEGWSQACDALKTELQEVQAERDVMAKDLETCRQSWKQDENALMLILREKGLCP